MHNVHAVLHDATLVHREHGGRDIDSASREPLAAAAQDEDTEQVHGDKTHLGELKDLVRGGYCKQ